MNSILPSRVLPLLLLALPIAAPRALADDTADRRSPIVRAVEKARPGVVSIRTNEMVRAPRYYDWFFTDGTTVPQEREGALGTGAIFHPAGYVITNAHVIARASKIFVQVTEASGREIEREAQIVSVDLDNDLAILRLLSKSGEPETYPWLALGRSDDLMIGETVIAIGNPFRLGITVTSGIISALRRSIRPRTAQDTEFRDFIQIDAAINPGNSGGPIVDITGRWVGVNTAILNRSSGAEGIGFAIPANRVREMIARTFKRRLVTGEWTGFDLEQGPGGLPVVSEVYSQGPAQEAGLKRGDRIVAIGGRATPTLYDYRVAELDAPTGATLALRVAREGEAERDMQVPLRALPLSALSLAKLGFVARDVLPEDTARVGVVARGGIVVTEVEEGGPAALISLKVGDVITALGTYSVRTLDDLVAVLEMVRPGDGVNVKVVRVLRDRYGAASQREFSGALKAH